MTDMSRDLRHRIQANAERVVRRDYDPSYVVITTRAQHERTQTQLKIMSETTAAGRGRRRARCADRLRRQLCQSHRRRGGRGTPARADASAQHCSSINTSSYGVKRGGIERYLGVATRHAEKRRLLGGSVVLDHLEASCSIGPSVTASTKFQVILNCLPNAASAQAAAAHA